MIIAVDTRFGDDYREFLHQTINRITKQNPQLSFIFIFEEMNNSEFISAKNIIPVFIKKARNPLLSQIAGNYKTAAVLKKYKADVFITAKDLVNTKVSQCLIFNKNLPKKFVQKAKLIITSSQFSKQNIIETYKIDEDKINVVYLGVDEKYIPIEFEEREKIKEQYANGREYFLCRNKNNSEDNLLNLLKAFSVFKKRQKSSMQLVISTKENLKPAFLDQLRLYKFKNDVIIYDEMVDNNIAGITAASYAAIYLSEDDFYFSPLEAMQCLVPVIVPDKNVEIEMAGDAALYANADDYKALGEKLMLIFKDEKLRSELIEKGKEQSKKYNWDNASAAVYRVIEKATA